MNLQAIWVANITGFLLILFLRVSRYITRSKKDTLDNAFDVITSMAMIACLVEPITFQIDGIPNKFYYWVNMIGNTYLYYVNGLGGFLWIMYADIKLFNDKSRMKKIYYKLAIPVGALQFSLLLNLKFKFFFYVDENFVYHRKSSLQIFYIYLVLCALYSIGLYFYHQRKYGKLAFFPIYMYLVPIITGSVVQMLYYGVSLAWLGTAIGIIALSMSLQQQKTYVDSLTGLYNRLLLEHTMYRISTNSSNTYYGIMIDMNHFKEINDSYGHSAGDQALKDVAKIIRNTVPKIPRVFRYAGDEFIIITKNQNEDAIKTIIANLQKALDDFNNQNDRPFTLSFAVGYDKFIYGEDDSDSFFKKIDTAMYKDKRNYHN